MPGRLLALLASSFFALRAALSGLLDVMFALVPAQPRPMLAGAFREPLEIDGHALQPDVQQSLRHEAGVPRVAAARNT